MVRKLAILVMAVGLVGIVLGSVFIALGVARYYDLKGAMQLEKITLGLTPEQVQEGKIVDSAESARVAGDTVRGHRHAIAPTYNDLLGGKPFDPTNPKEITYMQALNLENYLYMSVVAFGLTQSVMGSGVFMVIAGIAVSAIGWVLFKLGRLPQVSA